MHVQTHTSGLSSKLAEFFVLKAILSDIFGPYNLELQIGQSCLRIGPDEINSLLTVLTSPNFQHIFWGNIKIQNPMSMKMDPISAN